MIFTGKLEASSRIKVTVSRMRTMLESAEVNPVSNPAVRFITAPKLKYSRTALSLMMIPFEAIRSLTIWISSWIRCW